MTRKDDTVIAIRFMELAADEDEFIERLWQALQVATDRDSRARVLDAAAERYRSEYCGV